MLSEREKQFIEYWEANRDKEKKVTKQFMLGLPIGLLFSLPILIGLFSGRFWYQRADMQANASTSPTVLIIAILCITVFIAVFYKKHQWDMREQQYQELKARDKQNNPS